MAIQKASAISSLLRRLAAWLVLLNEDRYFILARIDFLVMFTTIVLFFMFVLDSHRYRSRSRTIRCALVLFDTIVDSFVTYTLGLMQIFPESQEGEDDPGYLFQVWAVMLITLKDNIRYISAYSLQDKDGRRRKEIRDVLDSFLVANLLATKSTRLVLPLWMLWGLNILKIIHSILAFDIADMSYAHGRNTRLVDGYMRGEHKCSQQGVLDDDDKHKNSSSNNNVTECKYLVFGEAEQKVKPGKPRYELHLSKTYEKKLITVDKVRNCKGRLLKSINDEGQIDAGREDPQVQRRKDICLSFALYKLLRRRFEGFANDHLQDEEREKNKKIIGEILEQKDDSERLFRIIRNELAFLSDYLYTRFPVVFASGLPYIYLVYFGISGIGIWLVVDLLVNDENVGYVEVIITIVIILFMRLAEWWEMITYLFSDWSKVLMLCKYVEKTSWQKSIVAEKVLGFLCNRTVTINWHNRIGQYDLLESFHYNPWIRNWFSLVFLRVFPIRKKGAKDGIGRLIHEAKVAIANSLHRTLTNSGADADRCLSNGVEALNENGVGDLMSWACELPTHAHTIFVWHIATALCEIHLSKNFKEIVTSGREKLTAIYILRCRNSFRSFLQSLCQRDDSTPERKSQLELLQCRFMVATSLSRYCAYLLTFAPDLLPDQILTAESIFMETIDNMNDLDYKGCKKNLGQVYETIMSDEKDDTIVHKGAKLARQLEYHCKEKDVEDPDQGAGTVGEKDDRLIMAELKRWKILEEFWAECILSLAPSNNIDAQSLSLNEGGEFITHLWALLYHVGILHPPCKPQNRKEDDACHEGEETTMEGRLHGKS